MIRKALLSACLMMLAFTVVAHEFKTEQFHVEHPWARPTFALATTGAAYLSLSNIGTQSDRIISASVEPDIADEVQLHDVLMEGEMMKMRQITAGVAVEPSETVDFMPGGKHIMLLGLKGPLNEGESFPLTLHFESSQPMVVIVNVEQPKQAPAPHAHHH